MTQREEAREQIATWVFEGKRIEEVKSLFSQSSFAGQLSPEDVEFEYYAAGSGKKLRRQSGISDHIYRTVGAFAVLGAFWNMGFFRFLGDFSPNLSPTGGGAMLMMLGMILIIWPHFGSDDVR